MNAFVLNSELDPIATINDYDSFIWTDRYSENGDFELVMPFDADVYDMIELKHTYLQIAESDRAMIIETISVSQDNDNFPTMTLSGRSVESMLLDRVLTSKTTIDSPIQNGVLKLLNKTIIKPSKDERRISNFSFEDKSSVYPIFDILEVSASFPIGTYLYDAVKALCDAVGVGFKVVIKDGGFVCSLYRGQNLTMEVSPEKPCIFSTAMQTLASSKFYASDEEFKNAAVVAGEENENGSRRVVTIEDDGAYGLYRHEVFIDANDIQQTDDDGNTVSSSKYTKMLRTRGRQSLKEYYRVKAFEGEIDNTGQNVYGEDYELGDIVDIVSEYGIAASARVLEIVLSKDDNGFTAVPTFGDAYNVEGKVKYDEGDEVTRIRSSEIVPLVGDALNGILG